MVIGEPWVKTHPLQELGPGSTAIQFPRPSVFRLTLHITPSTTSFSFLCLPPLIHSNRHQNNDGKAWVIDQTLTLKQAQDKSLCHFGHRKGLSELWSLPRSDPALPGDVSSRRRAFGCSTCPWAVRLFNWCQSWSCEHFLQRGSKRRVTEPHNGYSCRHAIDTSIHHARDGNKKFIITRKLAKCL